MQQVAVNVTNIPLQFLGQSFGVSGILALFWFIS